MSPFTDLYRAAGIHMVLVLKVSTIPPAERLPCSDTLANQDNWCSDYLEVSYTFL